MKGGVRGSKERRRNEKRRRGREEEEEVLDFFFRRIGKRELRWFLGGLCWCLVGLFGEEGDKGFFVRGEREEERGYEEWAAFASGSSFLDNGDVLLFPTLGVGYGRRVIVKFNV